MTRSRKPTVSEALEVLAAAWGDSWRVDTPVEAHVEYRPEVGGPVDTFRFYAVNGDRNVYLAQVPRAALEDGAR